MSFFLSIIFFKTPSAARRLQNNHTSMTSPKATTDMHFCEGPPTVNVVADDS